MDDTVLHQPAEWYKWSLTTEAETQQASSAARRTFSLFQHPGGVGALISTWWSGHISADHLKPRLRPFLLWKSKQAKSQTVVAVVVVIVVVVVVGRRGVVVSPASTTQTAVCTMQPPCAPQQPHLGLKLSAPNSHFINQDDLSSSEFIPLCAG